MLGLVSSSSTMVATDALKTVLPIGIGLASAAFLTMKMITPNTDKVKEMFLPACVAFGPSPNPLHFRPFRISSLFLGFSFTLQRDTSHTLELHLLSLEIGRHTNTVMICDMSNLFF